MTAKQTPLFDLLRMHADDIHSAHGYNKSSTLLSQAADHIVALEAERDQLREENDAARQLLRTICDERDRLREYARHNTRCERHRWQGDLRRECDCGYDDLIKEIGNE